MRPPHYCGDLDADDGQRCRLEIPCRRCTVDWLNEADARGDGPLVNALCAYGRERWGAGLYW